MKIKNFKIAHENSGRNDWELKARLAQINQKKETTKLNNVEYIFINDEMRKFKAYADFGTLSNKTNDLSLEGNVRMLIETGIVKDQITNNTISKKNNKPTKPMTSRHQRLIFCVALIFVLFNLYTPLGFSQPSKRQKPPKGEFPSDRDYFR